MSDIDDELLALAGGDASSDEEDTRDQSRSPSPSKSSDAPARGSAKRRASTPKGKRRASRDDQDSEDEGEASPPGSPDSQMSAPMDESDSDSDAPQTQGRGGDDDTNQYPFEGLFRSAEEKSRIMNMREIEREQILAERREENERIRQNRMLRQLKVNQEKDSKKRKASAADLEDASRKSARARTKAGETSEKMDTLRRAREERTSRREQRERDLDRRKQRSPSYNDRGRSRSVDSRNSDGGDWRRDSRQKSRSPEIKEILPAELRDVERIRVGRSRFAEVCFYPGFEKAITGCYVRINIGPDPKNHQDVYRMAVIKGFSQGRPYALTDSTGHQMVVDLYVKAAHGKAEREWPFISCSDRSFTEAEWNRYKQVCLSEGLQVPTKQELVNKIDDINRLVRRQWTEQELSEKLKRQNTLMAKFSTVERDSVTKLLEQARARNDQEAIERLQTKLENLDTPRLAFRTSLTSAKKSEGKGLSQQERLAALNTKNRKYNAEEVRKAQLKERARTALAKEKAKEQMKNGGASSQGDNKDAAKETEASLLEHIAKLQEQQRSQAKSGVPMIHKPLMDDDIIGALDLDIDVDID